MRTIKLIVSYDGSRYHGFQKQKNVATVQNLLEELLGKLCGEPVVTAGSGRTDAGVHAYAQTVTFTTTGRIPCANIVRASKSMLPADIIIRSATEVEEGFHARYSAKWKRYHYRVLINREENPFQVRYAWQMREQLDLPAMNEAAQLLLGTHDFSAFRSSGSVEGSPIKTIYEAQWTEQVGANGDRELCFAIAGDGFLYHMVRNIVWSLVQVGLHERTLEDFQKELASARGAFLSTPAPAEGLYLHNVYYNDWAENED